MAYHVCLAQLIDAVPGVIQPGEPWIAARYEGGSLPTLLTLGDGTHVGHYTNHPLALGVQNYQVFVRAYFNGNVSEQCLYMALRLTNGLLTWQCK